VVKCGTFRENCLRYRATRRRQFGGGLVLVVSDFKGARHQKLIPDKDPSSGSGTLSDPRTDQMGLTERRNETGHPRGELNAKCKRGQELNQHMGGMSGVLKVAY